MSAGSSVAFTTVFQQKVVKQLKESEKKALMAKRLLMAKKAKSSAVVRPKRRRIKQIFSNFVVLAVDTSNIPYETQGWTATLTRTTGASFSALFDEFGVAQFNGVNAPTTVSYTLRIRDADNSLLAQRNVPANREFFVARF